jgi:GntR family transcriptional regulator, transcriptional repressor for pyruvate dehydrogenase complex
MSPAPKEAGGASLVQRAMEAVNAHIHTEKLRVGDTLPGEAHFAAQLGVSRAVMREAFRSLAALKRIEVLNGRKPRVAAADASLLASTIDHALYTAQITVAEVWEVRRSIELRTAELAARHRTTAQADAIVALAERITAADDLATLTAHDIAFHEAIAEASGNQLYLQIFRAFSPLMQLAVPKAWNTVDDSARRQAIVQSHLQAAEAIRAGDATAAVAAFTVHFDETVGAVLGSGRA